ncbi:DNA-directed RNA polymerase III subunit RPC4 [Drosophila nasuta]|uniref:DNA-directed RNA polymerase III subunit RPC4 n=1 Tax=Drosophila albomicans TaxID=7291 RepID=A0A6P8WWP9_DROAB|nr:DNA-directed RNA polymerase III subunit RPC4 [Drosophila albomicans]XP_060651909.1 DNA-directed RNA polymerase III subunit RPC4 [Drosophila nasuta]
MANDSEKGSSKPEAAIPAKRLSTTAPPVANNNNNNATSDGSKKSNGMTRLTPARDLTLGGRGTSRKVFAPNLNAVRNKNTNVKTSKDFTQSRGRGRGARGAAGAARGRGAGGTGNSSLIQTTGVFSEGAGAVHLRKPSSGGGGSYARGGDEVTVSRKRTIGKDERTADQRVQDLISDDDVESASDDEMGGDKTELNYKPIMLKEGLWLSEKQVVKQEPQSIPSTNTDAAALPQQLESLFVHETPAQYGRYPRSIEAFLSTSQSPQLFVMQLPNVLPCVADDADDAPPAKAPADASTSTEQANSPMPATSTAANGPKPSVLQQLEEGQIGKILRYRSGRVKLLLGDTLFDLDLGLESGFLQELMSISCNREQRSGDMINLGHIQAKLKATPDWEHLFEQQAREERKRQPTPAAT